MIGSSVNDADCDGVATLEDCDDGNPFSTTVAEDQDCDGTPTAEDCDDLSPISTVVAQDQDCDGYVAATDCNDNDPLSTLVLQDNDCDNIPTAEDCEDNDPNVGWPGSDASCPAIDCSNIVIDGFSVGDGLYWLDPTGTGNSFEALCDMTTDGGGWTQVIGSNFNNDPCPGGWVQGSLTNGPAYCARAQGSSGNASTFIQTLGLTWDSVQIEVTAYQFGLMNGFDSCCSDLENHYMDGLSVTQGPGGAREHLFTFAIGASQDVAQATPAQTCPEDGGSPSIPAAVGENYTCASGNPGAPTASSWFPIPLFDSTQAIAFLGPPSSDDIEVRIMSSSDPGVGDILVEELAMWVRDSTPYCTAFPNDCMGDDDDSAGDDDDSAGDDDDSAGDDDDSAGDDDDSSN
jgi:hypothetical protein